MGVLPTNLLWVLEPGCFEADAGAGLAVGTLVWVDAASGSGGTALPVERGCTKQRLTRSGMLQEREATLYHVIQLEMEHSQEHTCQRARYRCCC